MLYDSLISLIFEQKPPATGSLEPEYPFSGDPQDDWDNS